MFNITGFLEARDRMASEPSDTLRIEAWLLHAVLLRCMRRVHILIGFRSNGVIYCELVVENDEFRHGTSPAIRQRCPNEVVNYTECI